MFRAPIVTANDIKTRNVIFQVEIGLDAVVKIIDEIESRPGLEVLSNTLQRPEQASIEITGIC